MWLGAGQSGAFTRYDAQADCLSNTNLKYQCKANLGLAKSADLYSFHEKLYSKW
jgi:hypothetical protein